MGFTCKLQWPVLLRIQTSRGFGFWTPEGLSRRIRLAHRTTQASCKLQAASCKKNNTRKLSRRKTEKMGYLLRVRMASFFSGVAVASLAGIYALHQDYKAAHQTLTRQANGLYQTLEGRISALEKVQEVEASKPVDAAP